MKIDRLIGILSILLQQKKVTAPFLAEKFEVSRRTINRDIEDICKAGIPLFTTQGANGGISIMEGYKIDHRLYTKAELQSILTGLKSLDSVSGTNQYQQLMDKISLDHENTHRADHHILIDLSSHYKSSLAPKFTSIQSAIKECKIISFYYYGPKKEEERRIAPYLLVFQWSSWYVRGYCQDRQDFRTFKLNRIENLVITEQTFIKFEEEENFKCNPIEAFPDNIYAKAVFEPCTKWRLIEEYGVESFKETEEDKLLFEFWFSDKEYMLNWFLSFGNQVELLEPNNFRTELLEHAKGMYQKYSES